MGLSVSEAAKALGKSEQFVRVGLQSGRLPFGSAVKMSSRWTYHISPELFTAYAGAIKKPPAATGGTASA